MAKERNPAGLWDQSADPSRLDLSFLPRDHKEIKALLKKSAERR